jgi:hypothetical protein
MGCHPNPNWRTPSFCKMVETTSQYINWFINPINYRIIDISH